MFLLAFALLISPLAAYAEEGLRRTVEALSATESRMTGYPGTEAARDWLVAELADMGVDEIYRHEFPVLVPSVVVTTWGDSRCGRGWQEYF